jgi:hypothetical protein
LPVFLESCLALPFRNKTFGIYAAGNAVSLVGTWWPVIAGALIVMPWRRGASPDMRRFAQRYQASFAKGRGESRCCAATRVRYATQRLSRKILSFDTNRATDCE